MLNRSYLIICLCILCFSCNRDQSAVFNLLDARETGITFNNTIHNADSLLLMSFEYVYNGGGVAIGDINNDGLSDIYFTGNMVSSRLYINKGDFKFEDITEKAGVGTSVWSSGASMVDINQDGFMDIYVCAGGLYNGKESRTNLLFINQGNDTFQERAKAYGLDDSNYSQHAAFLDYDKDGDLDLYLLTNELDPYNWKEYRPRRLNGEAPNTDKLYRNNGDNTFTEISKEAGILIEGYGLGIGICDINNDLWPDIYVANDFLSNDILYINQQDGTFKNEIASYLDHQSRNGMGTDLQDINNDGHTDIMVLDMLPVANLRQKTMFGLFDYDKYKFGLESGYQPQYARNTLQLNNGNGTFSEIGQLAGVNQTDWSWGTLMQDFDNDGLNDVLITNGFRLDVTNMDFATYSRQVTSSGIGTDEAKRDQMLAKLRELPDIKLHNYIYQNKGDLTFSDQSQEWGLSKPSYSNGTAFADLDNDGDLDIVMNNIDDEAFIYRNDISKSDKKPNSLRIKLEGKTPNRNGIGTKLTLYNKGSVQTKYFSPYRGYISTMENIIHFGLGIATSADSLEVIWPDGRSQLLSSIDANEVITVKQSEATNRKGVQSTNTPQQFVEISDSLQIKFTHQEQDFADFKVQPILPHRHSQTGPGIAIGDINNDGLDDFYVGGSGNYKGSMFVQHTDGSFESISQNIDSTLEDMGSLFFDADNDGDTDLYIVGGGSGSQATSPAFQDQLYLNDGSGRMIKSNDALPEVKGSGSSVIAGDYDRDGDLDLFVGGRIVPGSYPTPAQSYLLRNDSKNGQCKFTDVSADRLPNGGVIGLVTSALWSDYDMDGLSDLIVVGEWMPITIFKNTGVEFEEMTTQAGLKNTNGWWNSLASGDFDRDGDIDYLAGNLGLNTQFKASEKEPVCIYAKDYDKNGRIDPVMCYYIEGENYIAHSRDNLIEQISSMRSRFKTYTEYGETPFSRSFMKEELEDAYIVKSQTFATSYIENKGNGKFEISPLPVKAQIAPIFGLLVEDFNQDGHLDALAVGNSYSTEVSLGQYDACKGLYMMGDGQGHFEVSSNGTNGFFVDGDGKALSRLHTADNDYLYLTSQNSGDLKAFKKHQDNTRKIKLKPNDTYAMLYYRDGSTARQEFYYGSTYLSQSSRTIEGNELIKKIVIYDSNGQERTVDIKG